MFFDEHFILGQVIEAANVPSDIGSYVYVQDEVKFYRPQCNLSTGKFVGLYETVGLIIVGANNNETFINHGFKKD